MEQTSATSLVTPLGAAIDAAIAGVIFLLFAVFIIPPHVPFYEPLWVYGFSTYTGLIMGGFFWLGLSLFRVTLVDQLRRRRAAAAGKA